MTDAPGKRDKRPERIWARPDYFECWPKRGEEEDVEYTRTDLIPALEAAAYARGLEDAAKVLDRHDSVPVHPHPEWDEKFSDGYETGQMDAASSWQYAIRALGAKPTGDDT